MTEARIFELENGIRVVHQQTEPDSILHCGLYVHAGTRDEPEGKNGLAHFIEHVLFKGTTTRKPFHILNRLESVGGEINAFTTKEETCLHASVLPEHFGRALELISDVMLNSTFPEKEIRKEKEVILDEIRSCMDNPAEQIYDDFEEMVFKGHPLALPILGSEDSVKALDRKDILSFMEEVYSNENMVLSVVGELSEQKIRMVAEKYIGIFNFKGRRQRKKLELENKPAKKEIGNRNFQAHCMLGGPAYDYFSPKRITLILLNNMLGGPGMNSRLNLNLREKHGIAYNLYSCYTPYSDAGLTGVYIGTDNQNIERSISITLRELKNLREKKLGKLQLSQAKRQLIGQIALNQESRSGLMQVIGKSVLSYGKVETLEEVFSKINRITEEELLEVANEVYDEKGFSYLIYKG